MCLPDDNLFTSLSFSQLGAAVAKNSPYKKFLEHKLLQLQESGTTEFISKRWEEGKPVCEDELNKDSQAMGPGLHNFKPNTAELN